MTCRAHQKCRIWMADRCFAHHTIQHNTFVSKFPKSRTLKECYGLLEEFLISCCATPFPVVSSICNSRHSNAIVIWWTYVLPYGLTCGHVNTSASRSGNSGLTKWLSVHHTSSSSLAEESVLQNQENDSMQWSLASLASHNGQTKLLGLTSLIGTAAVAGGGFLGRHLGMATYVYILFQCSVSSQPCHLGLDLAVLQVDLTIAGWKNILL